MRNVSTFNGRTTRIRTLRPQTGEVKRWVVIQDGTPRCIKVMRREAYSPPTLGYSVTVEPVFVWLP